MKTILAKGRHVLGKLSRNGDKRAPRNCEAVLTWELREQEGKPEFSAQGEVWNHLKTDIVQGGQCVEELAAKFPRDVRAQRICAVWVKYHLNGMNAGTPEQSAALEAGRAKLAERMRREGDAGRLFYSEGKPNWHAVAAHLGKSSAYEIDQDILLTGGLLEVPVTDELRASALGGLPPDAKVYRYGTCWLYRPIPDDVIALIKRGFQDECETLAADPDEAGEPDTDLLAESGLSIVAQFVPFSQSRNKKEKQPSLNWRITVQHNGLALFVCDYSAGSAHCPAYGNKTRWTPAERRDAIALECEKGRTVKRFLASLSMPQYGEAIEPNARDVISSLLHDCSAIDCRSFEDWCAESGVDGDTRKARETYNECMAHAVALRAAVGSVMFDKLREGNA